MLVIHVDNASAATAVASVVYHRLIQASAASFRATHACASADRTAYKFEVFGA